MAPVRPSGPAPWRKVELLPKGAQCGQSPRRAANSVGLWAGIREQAGGAGVPRPQNLVKTLCKSDLTSVPINVIPD